MLLIIFTPIISTSLKPIYKEDIPYLSPKRPSLHIAFSEFVLVKTVFWNWSILLLADLRKVNHKHLPSKDKKKIEQGKLSKLLKNGSVEIREGTLVTGQDTIVTSREKSEVTHI